MHFNFSLPLVFFQVFSKRDLAFFAYALCDFFTALRKMRIIANRHEEQV